MVIINVFPIEFQWNHIENQLLNQFFQILYEFNLYDLDISTRNSYHELTKISLTTSIQILKKRQYKEKYNLI